MSNPFIIQDGSVIISQADVVSAQIIACAGLPVEFGAESEMQADLLERRLARLEQALSLDPIK